MKPWKAILAAMILFLAGGLCGGMVSHLYHTRAVVPPPPVVPGGPRMPRASQHMQMMDRMSKRLDLTPEQREAVEKLMLATQERMREIWREVSPKAKEEMETLHQRIEAELTDDQQERYRALIREFPSRRGSPGSFRHREGREGEAGGGRGRSRWGPDREGPRGPGRPEQERPSGPEGTRRPGEPEGSASPEDSRRPPAETASDGEPRE